MYILLSDRLNPCFIGIYSLSPEENLDNAQNAGGLNPCFIGIYSLSMLGYVPSALGQKVLILVLLEYTL